MYISMNDSMKGNPIQKNCDIIVWPVDVVIIILMWINLKIKLENMESLLKNHNFKKRVSAC